MKGYTDFDFSNCEVVDYLWPQFVDRLGIERSKQAISQTLDMQRMNGNSGTVPILIVDTCGLALASTDTLYLQTGILSNRHGLILLLSIKAKVIQLIGEV
tara:strand:- start:466 stop:765 length:300 start_codon:yes stop_codon:yes gene_type:complete